MGLQLLSHDFHVILGAPDVVAGFVVAGLGQGSQGMDGDLLNGLDLLGALFHLGFQVFVFVAQKIGRGLEREVGFDPGPHDGRAHGLGDVIHGPETQAEFLVSGFRLCGEKDNRHVLGRRGGLEPAADLVAVETRHHDVQDDQVRGGALGYAQGLLAVGGDFDLVIRAQKIA